MRTATCLTLVAIGAILTFAVTAHPSFLDLQVTGVVIMIVGVAGLFLNRRTSGWLRRRVVLRKGATGPVVGHIDQTNYPSYVSIDPAALESVQPAPDEDGPAPIPDTSADIIRDAGLGVGNERSRSEQPLVVEEYLEE
jgi:hypothetical protein